MFRLIRKKRKLSLMEDLLNLAIEDLKDEWIDFTKDIRFKNSVPLSENIDNFAQPLVESFKNRYMTLYQYSGNIFVYAVSKAILKSKTHHRTNLNIAIKEFELKYSKED